MAWRTVLIQNPADLRLKKGQFHLKNENGVYSLPVEDIGVVILDSPRILLSSALLSAMNENGVALVSCDSRHMPCGVMTAFHPHSRQTRTAHLQTGWSGPFRKRAWQYIIRRKIANQADCLKRHGIDGWKHLENLIPKVKSGDPDNLEARAARAYWTHLFDKKFKRRADDTLNAALNYGYAIIRSCMARSLVAYGFIPAFGLHHKSQLNAYNLADDLLEPLRPFVDDYVRENLDVFDDEGGLSRDMRRVLADIPNMQADLRGEVFTLTNICDAMAAGLGSAGKDGKPDTIPVPEFIGGKI